MNLSGLEISANRSNPLPLGSEKADLYSRNTNKISIQSKLFRCLANKQCDGLIEESDRNNNES